ncbi:MAG: hypothetical protein V3U63_07800 [Gemmatimonadota bacterium]
MPVLQIEAYRVGVSCRTNDDFTRFLFLEPDPAYRGPGSSGVRIFFEPEASEIGRSAAGFLVPTLSENYFGDMYHVLQTEKPIYFSWGFDEGGEQIDWCDISTTEEPTGEGYTDTSDSFRARRS